MGGSSCLAILLDYAFSGDLSVGDRIIFEDMMHYTMVKTRCLTVHPSIGVLKKDGIRALAAVFL